MLFRSSLGSGSLLGRNARAPAPLAGPSDGGPWREGYREQGRTPGWPHLRAGSPLWNPGPAGWSSGPQPPSPLTPQARLPQPLLPRLKEVLKPPAPARLPLLMAPAPSWGGPHCPLQVRFPLWPWAGVGYGGGRGLGVRRGGGVEEAMGRRRPEEARRPQGSRRPGAGHGGLGARRDSAGLGARKAGARFADRSPR